MNQENSPKNSVKDDTLRMNIVSVDFLLQLVLLISNEMSNSRVLLVQITS